MYCGLKNVYFLFFVKNPRSSARLKSDMALLRKPACLASSRDINVKISATAHAHNSLSIAHGLSSGYSMVAALQNTGLGD